MSGALEARIAELRETAQTGALDITSEVLKRLDKALPSIKLEIPKKAG